MRSNEEIYADLDRAYGRGRELRLGTEEYRKNRHIIHALNRELAAANPVRAAEFTVEDYRSNSPDSFETLAERRKREGRAA